MTERSGGRDRRRRQRCVLIKAKQRVSALRGGQPDDLAAKRGRLRLNFVAARLDETQNHAQQTGNPGNVE
jgi:hypothetical protein